MINAGTAHNEEQATANIAKQKTQWMIMYYGPKQASKSPQRNQKPKLSKMGANPIAQHLSIKIIAHI